VARVARAELRIWCDLARIAIEWAIVSWAQAIVSRGVGHSLIGLSACLPVPGGAYNPSSVRLAGEDGKRSEAAAAGRGR
jgi:hypothetical protein